MFKTIEWEKNIIFKPKNNRDIEYFLISTDTYIGKERILYYCANRGKIIFIRVKQF